MNLNTITIASILYYKCNSFRCTETFDLVVVSCFYAILSITSPEISTGVYCVTNRRTNGLTDKPTDGLKDRDARIRIRKAARTLLRTKATHEICIGIVLISYSESLQVCSVRQC